LQPRRRPPKATWRSGYATVCKTVYPGSIPGVASSLHSRSEAKVARRSVAKAARASRCELQLGTRPGATVGKPARAKPRQTHRNFRRFAAFKARPALLYALRARQLLFPGSSAVEQPAVNRLVAGSNPARGAIFNQRLGGFTPVRSSIRRFGATASATVVEPAGPACARCVTVPCRSTPPQSPSAQ
jgi:hypothetical protein